MTIEITYECWTCQHRNRQNLGMPGFELIQTEFDSLSDAINHWNHNKDCDIRTVVVINEGSNGGDNE